MSNQGKFIAVVAHIFHAHFLKQKLFDCLKLKTNGYQWDNGDCRFPNDLSTCHSFCFANVFKGQHRDCDPNACKCQIHETLQALLLATVDAPFRNYDTVQKD